MIIISSAISSCVLRTRRPKRLVMWNRSTEYMKYTCRHVGGRCNPSLKSPIPALYGVPTIRLAKLTNPAPNTSPNQHQNPAAKTRAWDTQLSNTFESRFSSHVPVNEYDTNAAQPCLSALSLPNHSRQTGKVLKHSTCPRIFSWLIPFTTFFWSANKDFFYQRNRVRFVE